MLPTTPTQTYHRSPSRGDPSENLNSKLQGQNFDIRYLGPKKSSLEAPRKNCKDPSRLFWFSSPKKHRSHHTVIPRWNYRIPSELRSQAPLGSPSTAVGDHAGIVSAVCFLPGSTLILVQWPKKNIGPIIRSYHGGTTASHPNCEVKHRWAHLVLRWGTTWES